MNSMLLAVLAFVAISAGGFALVPLLRGSSRAEKRMKALQGDIKVARRETALARTRDDRRKSVQAALKTQNEALAKSRRYNLQQRLFQAGMTISVRDFIRNSIIIGVVAAVICWVLQVPILFSLVFGLAAGYLLPRFWIGRRRKRYQDKFLDELPNAVEAIVRGVKSGLPLNDSMRIVSKEVKEPVRSEFQRVLDQQAIGKSMMEAVPVLFDRVPLPEVNFFVVVITVQQQAGGNLSEALTNLSRVLRNRKKMKGKVKAMTSEANASAMIIGSLPFVVSTLVSIVTPGYFAPFFETDIGMVLLGGAGIMMLMGVLVMRKMIQFDF
jgi:tight adherence protein B